MGNQVHPDHDIAHQDEGRDLGRPPAPAGNARSDSGAAGKVRSWGRLAGLALCCCAAVLPGWMVILGLTLPGRFSARRWAVGWIGLDALELVTLCATGWLTLRRERRVAPFAGAATVLLLADGWFDIVTAKAGSDYLMAILVALTVEVPLALLCGAIAWSSEGWDAEGSGAFQYGTTRRCKAR